MSNGNPLIQGLEQVRKAELHASEYYAVARTTAEKNHRHEIAEIYKALGGVHAQLALQFEGRKEQLEKADGEGIFGEMFENVKEAFRSFVADLPVLFVEKETHPTPNMLIGLEQDLAAKYEELKNVADNETAMILSSAIDASRRHVEVLQGL